MNSARHFWLCLVFTVSLIGCSGSDRPDPGASVDGRESAIPEAVRRELVQLGMDDQELRQGLTPERIQDTVLAGNILRGDSARTVRLQAIVEEYGWPDTVRAGPEAAKAAFLILQHSPLHEFQEAMLPVLEDLVKQGAVPSDDAAMLIDRVLMHQGLPQRYGTQFNMEDGRLVLHPVEDESGLEERRKAVGLPGMEEYMRMLEEFTKTPVVRRP
jgi:hypothetical protein